MYRAYLNSQEVDAIFAGNRAALAGIDILRKICNHPDLIERSKWENSELYGKPERSGKLTVTMKVVAPLQGTICLHGTTARLHDQTCILHAHCAVVYKGANDRRTSDISLTLCKQLAYKATDSPSRWLNPILSHGVEIG